jgi:trans-2,3-dihydro-3-hydroxyanthranilate isomerase
MAAIAREFNQSETTFITTATRADELGRLRSFTPDGSEDTGAGHNSLGAWWGSGMQRYSQWRYGAVGRL